MRYRSTILLLTLVATHVSPAQQAGDPDSTFSADGITVTNINPGNDYGLAMALQPDGRIVAAGMTTTTEAPSERVALVRYMPDGSLDSSFGNAGVTSTAIGTIRSQATAVAIQPDGRIIIAGFASSGASSSVFMLARYQPDGSLDNAFGDNGILFDDLGPQNDRANGMVLQPDGRIVVTGQAGGDHAVVRYNADGSRDNSFGIDGIRIMDIAGGVDVANAVVLQPDGYIVVAGHSVSQDDPDAQATLVRYAPDGSLDPTFGTAGIQVSAFTSNDDMSHAIALQADGRIVVAGANIGVGIYQVLLARHLADGSVDASFDDDGFILMPIGSTSTLSSVVVLTDGKILAGGRTDTRFLLMRFESDGAMDDGFGANGVVNTFIGSNASGAGLLVQPDGMALLCGFAWFAPAYADVVVVRYHMDSPAGLTEWGEQPAALRLFPNPVTDNFQLDLPLVDGAWALQVLDATGRLVHQERITGLSSTVDVSALGAGPYHVVAKHGSTNRAGRVMVVR